MVKISSFRTLVVAQLVERFFPTTTTQICSRTNLVIWEFLFTINCTKKCVEKTKMKKNRIYHFLSILIFKRCRKNNEQNYIIDIAVIRTELTWKAKLSGIWDVLPTKVDAIKIFFRWKLHSLKVKQDKCSNLVIIDSFITSFWWWIKK